MNKCSICGNEIEVKHGWTHGNNAEPVNDGRCCDECDCNIVIPRRLREAGVPDHAAKAVGELDMKLRKNPPDLAKGFKEALKKTGFITKEDKDE